MRADAVAVLADDQAVLPHPVVQHPVATRVHDVEAGRDARR